MRFLRTNGTVKPSKADYSSVADDTQYDSRRFRYERPFGSNFLYVDTNYLYVDFLSSLMGGGFLIFETYRFCK